MKTVIVSIISSIFTAIIVFVLMNIFIKQRQENERLAIINLTRQTVQKNLAYQESDIQRQLTALSKVIAADKDFSLKILVENDPSSRVITEMASQFINPMNFSVLEITDSAYTILSSGHFPANAGNSCASKSRMLSEKPAVCIDNIMGTPTLTMQAKRKFTIADFAFYITGGISIDTGFLSKLLPAKNMTLLLKKGNEYIGIDNVRSISGLKDNQIIINDKKYMASVITLPSVGISDSLSLFVLVAK